MKKIICLVLVLALALSLVACGKQIDDGPAGDDTENTDNVENNTNPDETDEPENGYPFELDFIKDNGIQYIWDRLDEDTRYNLGEIMNAIKNVEIYCSLSVGMPKEELSDFTELVSNCSMGYTYVGNVFKGHTDESGKIIGITINYSIAYEHEGPERTSLVWDRVNEAVAGMPNGTDYEKLKYLHDYLILKCDYSEQAESPFTAFGALVEGKATCQGYADAMHLLLAGAGYETVFATGIGDDEAVKHKWNYVKLSDGKWYIIDPTWDDPKGKDDKTYIGYDYFMVSTEMLATDHKETFISPYYELPVAESMELSYYVMNDYYATTYDEVVEIIERQASEIVPKGEKHIYLRCADNTLLEEANTKLFSGDYEMQEILIKVQSETMAESLITNSWTKVVKDGPCTMTITLKYE
ncbi:MAG: hypothetical protein IJ424_02230 [Oscillospiraceae bacterium]|nr:hypothetical protein [Oscillospiraceae bacterium]